MATVLIVDDRRDAIAALEAMLTKRGFSVITVSSGRDAVEGCRSGNINVVIMDLNMPDFDGCDATMELKACAETKHIPIILCSAQPLPDDRERAISSGASHFLEKPVPVDDLVSILSQLLQPDEDTVETIEAPKVA